MAGADASAYLSAVKWGDEGYYMGEFVHKMQLPQVAKIIKGQYLNLGVPTLASPSLNQIVFLSSGGTRIKVAAQCVKFKEGRKVIPVGPKLAIPDNYPGWFEILSEDGRAVRGIESVAELAKRNPETCVVRDPIKALVSKTEDPDAVAEKSRTLQPGETLILVGEATASAIKGKNASGRYLRCLTSKNETVYLNTESKGRFSPVAGEENISGVHSIRNLLTKRLPMMVRLVSGKAPAGLKSSSQFLPEMRLYSLFEEDCVVALPLLKDSSRIVPLPTSVPLKLLAPKNADVLVKLREYGRLNEKCQSMITGVSDQIQVFDISMSKELRNDFRNNNNHFHHSVLGGARRFSHVQRTRKLPHIHLIQRSLSDPQGTNSLNGQVKVTVPAAVLELTPKPTITTTTTTVASSTVKEVKEAPVDTRYDEIDQIYDYVRGFAPLPAKINSDFVSEGPVSRQSSSESTPATAPASPLVSGINLSVVSPSPPTDTKLVRSSPPPASPPAVTSSSLIVNEKKPEPPPIETIPVRKNSTTGESLANQQVSHKPASVSVSLQSSKSRSPRKKEVPKERKFMTENHIYEKLNKRKEEVAVTTPNHVAVSGGSCVTATSSKVPVRSSSGKLPYQAPPCNTVQVGPSSLPNTTTVSSTSANRKLFVKSPVQQRTQHKSRFFKHFKGSPREPVQQLLQHQQPSHHYHQQPSPVKTYLPSNASKSLSTSPLFNIRYKSLTNLAVDFNTLDSSNSGGQTTSSGSAGSKEHRPREPKIQKRSRLPRPRSLTNLLWDISQVDSRNRYNLMRNDSKGTTRKFIFAPNANESKYSSGSQTKAIGTLYL